MGAASFAAAGCDGPAVGVLGAGAALGTGAALGAGAAVGVDGAIGFWALLANARNAAAKANIKISLDMHRRRALQIVIDQQDGADR